MYLNFCANRLLDNHLDFCGNVVVKNLNLFPLCSLTELFFYLSRSNSRFYR